VEQHGTHRFRRLCTIESRPQVRDHGGIDGVELLGPVEAKHRDRTLFRVGDQGHAARDATGTGAGPQSTRAPGGGFRPSCWGVPR